MVVLKLSCSVHCCRVGWLKLSAHVSGSGHGTISHRSPGKAGAGSDAVKSCCFFCYHRVFGNSEWRSRAQLDWLYFKRCCSTSGSSYSANRVAMLSNLEEPPSAEAGLEPHALMLLTQKKKVAHFKSSVRTFVGVLSLGVTWRRCSTN